MVGKKKTTRRGRPQTRFPAGPNLVTTFKEIVTRNGRDFDDALSKLNSGLGRTYTKTRFTEMEIGEKGRSPNPELVNYMLGVVVPVLLKEYSDLNRAEINDFLSKIKLVVPE